LKPFVITVSSPFPPSACVAAFYTLSAEGIDLNHRYVLIMVQGAAPT
jgi:hypothetical protein